MATNIIGGIRGPGKPIGPLGSKPYQDLFAQEFAVSVNQGSLAVAPNSTPEAGPALPFINWILRSNQLFCTMGTVENLRAGRAAHNTFTQCPTTVDSDFTH
jgi:hypothetical protein